MKKILLLLAIAYSASLFSQADKFKGRWIYEPADYILDINLAENGTKKLYFYNADKTDSIFESIVYYSDEKIVTSDTYSDTGIIYCVYEIVDNTLNCTFKPSNYKITYKKTKDGIQTRGWKRPND
jgi:hypothetical protein